MNGEPEIQKTVADSPEFWLGQVKAVTDMEQNGALTKAKIVTEIRRIMKRMTQHVSKGTT